MKDPYEVLGLNPNATDEEIKAAYHELVKKYHPDKYQDNPLAELAGEKLREVNEAYDTLMKQGVTTPGSNYGSTTYGTGSYGTGTYGTGTYNGGGYTNYNTSGHGTYGGNYGSGTQGSYGGTQYSSYNGAKFDQDYVQIRNALNRGELYKADQLLINHATRDAEWFYLSGILAYRRGYVDDALTNIRQAMSMAPNVREYRDMYQRLTGSGTLYQTTSNNKGYSSSDMCAQCITCYCLSSLCSPCW